MTFKNIVTKKTYTKDGQEKATWNNVGTLKITDDGKMFIELAMFPNTDFYVFDREEKKTPGDIMRQAMTEPKVPDGIPF